MKQGSLRSSAYAVLTALIWGTAFVAQSVGAEHVPPLAFNAARSVIAFVFLLVLCAVMRSGRRRKGQAASVTRSRKDLLLGGFWCGLTLGLASFLQQKGLDTTSPGKVCKALDLTTAQNKLDLEGDVLFLCDSMADVGLTDPVTGPEHICAGPRIGVDYAEEAKDFPWRFWLEKEN